MAGASPAGSLVQLTGRVPSPVVGLDDARAARFGVRVYLKRDDLIDPEIPGNKWRKLKYNLARARDEGFDRLLTFGGAYSNHIRAAAAAGRRLGFATVGVIRGEEHRPLNESLSFAVGQGMVLTYLDRATYRRKTGSDVLARLLGEFGPCYVIPEGGSNRLGVRGCAELPAEVSVGFDVMCCACGTGGTLAGIGAGLNQGDARCLGFAVLKARGYLEDEVRRLQIEAFGAATANWSIDHDYHFGGYARQPPELARFVTDFESRHGVTLDPVYEAKMLYGLFDQISAHRYADGTTIVAVLS